MTRGAYDNTSLSLDRARAVHAALVEQSPLDGYRNRLAQPLFSFSAYADKRLLPGIDPTDARNRRVDLRIVLTYRSPAELEATLTQARAADAAASR
jgi:flagellar motor protein MotB